MLRSFFFKLVALMFVFVFICISSGMYWLSSVPNINGPKTTIEIKDGEKFSTIVAKLEKNNIIKWPLMFKIYSRFFQLDKQIKAGTYELESDLTPAEVKEKLFRGMVSLVEFIHPPGYNMWQVAENLGKQIPNISIQEWSEAFTNPLPISSLAPEATSLEGYLYPDLYRIHLKPNINEVISLMLSTFKKNMTPEIIEKGRKLGMSPHQIVTLASIIEKETGDGAERRLISAVFHSRLKIKMKLQTDPTVIYGIWNRFDGNLRKKDLENPTQYNTYMIYGLPPGPIANPGLEAIQAAVEPADESYLYFVSKGDGTHYFSKNLSEHNAAVRRYQIKSSRAQRSEN